MEQDSGNQPDLVCSALNLMRRLPTRDSRKNLDFLLKKLPEYEQELLSSVDRPLEVLLCPETNQRFIASEYNRNGDSYRSPWTGEYHPLSESGYKPRQEIRELEIYLNDAFKLYVKLYFDEGVSSVYTWEHDSSFAVAILIKRELNISQGLWDSIHVIDVTTSGSSATYKLTSTVMVALGSKNDLPDCNEMDITGSLMKQTEATYPIKKNITSHTPNIGRLVEKVENSLRTSVCYIYFEKLRYVMNDMRKHTSDENYDENARDSTRRELNFKLSLIGEQ